MDGDRGPNKVGVMADQQALTSSFDIIHSLLKRLDKLLELAFIDQDTTFVDKVIKLGQDIQAVCGVDPDAAVGTIQLIFETPHGLEHSLHNAILCEVACRRLGKDPLDRLSLVVAALTHDLGMYDIQQELSVQETPLTGVQRQIINSHPDQSCDLLKNKGVTDRRWLNAIRHHHERLDGSGYPGAVEEGKIGFDAKLLAITDNYTALVRPRSYRERVLHKDALKEMMTDRGKAIDGRLASLFISSIGIYAPGSLVKMDDGVIGVVLALSKKLDTPKVLLIADALGKPLKKRSEVDTYYEESRIEHMLCPQQHRELVESLTNIWMLESPLV